MAGRKVNPYFWITVFIMALYGVLFMIYAFIGLFNNLAISIMNSEDFPSCLFFWKTNLLDLLSLNSSFYLVKALLLACCSICIFFILKRKQIFLWLFIIIGACSFILPYLYCGKSGLHLGDAMFYLLFAALLCVFVFRKEKTSSLHAKEDKEEKLSTKRY